MHIQQALQQATKKLKKSKIESPSLDAEVLLTHVLKNTKEELYTHPKTKLKPSQLTAYNKLTQRRAKHEPIAYIISHKEFYGLDFIVNKDVLIPRPETEIMVDEVINILKRSVSICHGRDKLTPTTIVDVGTGSGCVIISVAKNLSQILSSRATAGSRGIPYNSWSARDSSPRSSEARNDTLIHLFATDISCNALRLARLNARRHGVEKQIKFLPGNLLEPISKIRNLANSQFRNLIITANLPYLPTPEWRRAMPDVKKYEPRQALDGGPDGLKYYRQLFRQIKKSREVGPRVVRLGRTAEVRPLRIPEIIILCEICPHQRTKITTIIKKLFPQAVITSIKDLADKDRIIQAIIRG